MAAFEVIASRAVERRILKPHQWDDAISAMWLRAFWIFQHGRYDPAAGSFLNYFWLGGMKVCQAIAEDGRDTRAVRNTRTVEPVIMEAPSLAALDELDIEALRLRMFGCTVAGVAAGLGLTPRGAQDRIGRLRRRASVAA